MASPSVSYSQAIVAELPQSHFTVGPILLDLHPQLQMHRALPQVVELDSREPSNLLEPLPALTDDDGLLSGALHPDHGIDHDPVVFVGEPFDLHVDAVGQFLAKFE